MGQIKKVKSYFFIFAGIFFFVFGLIDLVENINKGFKMQFPGGDWISILFTIQGVCFFIIGLNVNKSNKE